MIVDKIKRMHEKALQDDIKKIVSGAFIVKDGMFLILTRSENEDFMAGFDEIPSGHVDDGETIAQALYREVAEETGLKISKITSYANSFDYASSSGKKTRQFNFLVEVEEGDVVLNPAEHSKYCWINPSSPEFAALNLSAETRQCIVSANRIIQGFPKFVTLDGIDAVGKSTQIKELKKRLEGKIAVKTIDEFSDSDIGELIKKIIVARQFFSLKEPGAAVRSETALLISDLLLKSEYEVDKLGNEADLIISDRGLVSILAYQGIRLSQSSGLSQEEAVSWVRELTKAALSGTREADLNVILTATLDEVEDRCTKRGESLSADDIKFLDKVQQRIIVEASHPDNKCRVIDISGISSEQVTSRIIGIISEQFGWGFLSPATKINPVYKI